MLYVIGNFFKEIVYIVKLENCKLLLQLYNNMVLFISFIGKSTNWKKYQYGTFSLGKGTILHLILFSHLHFFLYSEQSYICYIKTNRKKSPYVPKHKWYVNIHTKWLSCICQFINKNSFIYLFKSANNCFSEANNIIV